MRPLKAVVIATNEKIGIEVMLESGNTITTLTDKSYYVGQVLSISYDFAEKKVLSIVSQYYTENMPNNTKAKQVWGDDNDPEDPEILEALNI